MLTPRQRLESEKKYKTYTYGVYPEVSLQKARKKHEKIHELVSDGIDPHTEKKRELYEQRLNQDNTFQSLTYEWLEKHEKEINPETFKGKKKILETDVFPEIGHIPVKELEPKNFLNMLRKIEARADIFDYIEFFYNPKRKHGKNGMLSPIDFERQQKWKQQGV